MARQWMSSDSKDNLYWIWRNVRQLGQGKMLLMVTWASDAYAFRTFVTLQLWITHVKVERSKINHHKFEKWKKECRHLWKETPDKKINKDEAGFLPHFQQCLEWDIKVWRAVLIYCTVYVYINICILYLLMNRRYKGEDGPSGQIHYSSII